MASVTVRPNRTPRLGAWEVVGGTTADAATADDLDTSFVRALANQYGTVEIGFTPISLPPLAQIRQVTARYRGAPTIGTTAYYLVWNLVTDPNGAVALGSGVNPSSTPATYSSAPQTKAFGGGDWTEALVNTARQSFYQWPAPPVGGPRYRVHEAYLDVVYNEAPTCTVTGPADEDANVAGVQVVNTSFPRISWTYADVEGDLQERYRAKVFTSAQYSAGGFDPDVTPATWDSQRIFSSTTYADVPTPLSNGVHRAYVKVADAGSQGRWSAWAYREWTQVVVPPPVPVLTVTPVAGAGLAISAVSTGTPSVVFFIVEFLDEDGIWRTVRGGDRVSATAGVASVLTDFEAPINVARSYRATAGRPVSGKDLVSAPSAIVSGTVLDANWWLRDPLVASASRVITVAPPFQALQPRPTTVHDPLGATTAVVVSDGLRSARGQLTLRTDGVAEYTAIQTILAQDRTLLLSSPLGLQWYVRLGEVTAELRLAMRNPGDAWPIRHLFELRVAWTQVERP